MNDAIKIITTLIGVALILGGLLAGVGYLVLPLFVTGSEAVQTNTIVGTMALLGLAMGAGLSYEGFNALSGRRSSPVLLPPMVILVLLFLGVLIVGQAALRSGPMAAWFFPPFHVLAIALPILMILRFVAGRTPGLPGRELTLQVAYGGVVSTLLALFLEVVLLLVLAVVVFSTVSLFPQGQTWLQELARNLQDPYWLQDPANLEGLLLAPPVLILVGFAATLVAPLIEETVKGLGAAAIAYRQPGRAQAFAWGVAAGAGFALVEGTLNSAILLEAWTLGVLLRVGASLLHTVTTGIVAVGWREALVARRPRGLLAALAFTVALHGLWNALALGTLVASVSVAGSVGTPGAGLSAAGLFGLPILLGMTVVGCVILLIVFSSRWRAE